MAGFCICAFDALGYQKFFQSDGIVIVISDQGDRLFACEGKVDDQTEANLIVQEAESVCLETQGELGLRCHDSVDTVCCERGCDSVVGGDGASIFANEACC